MKGKTLSILMASILVFSVLTGCSDSRSKGEVDASIDTSGKVVVRAALVDALWEIGEEVPDDAKCVAESVFTIDSNLGFMIMKNNEPTDYNQAPVIAVSSINVVLSDPTTDGRGPSCGDGELRYIVTASQEAPIDMDVVEEIVTRHNIETIAKDEPTPYPSGCKITAHFEKHDGSAPKDMATQEIEDEEDNEDEAEEDVEDEEAEPIYTLKFVVDDYDCRLYE